MNSADKIGVAHIGRKRSGPRTGVIPPFTLTSDMPTFLGIEGSVRGKAATQPSDGTRQARHLQAPSL